MPEHDGLCVYNVFSEGTPPTGVQCPQCPQFFPATEVLEHVGHDVFDVWVPRRELEIHLLEHAMQS